MQNQIICPVCKKPLSLSLTTGYYQHDKSEAGKCGYYISQHAFQNSNQTLQNAQASAEA